MGAAGSLVTACGSAVGTGAAPLAGATSPAAAPSPTVRPIAVAGTTTARATVETVATRATVPGPSPVSTPPPPAASLPPGCRRPPATRCLVTVTAADAGRTLRLLVGTRIRLTLVGSRAFGWRSARSSDPTVLRPVPDPLMTAIPIGWVRTDFLVVRTGRAVITAVQAPACAADHPPCLVPDRLFALTVLARR